jgi:hypothetical protein
MKEHDVTREDKVQLRTLRDDIEAEEDKRLLRKTLTYIDDLEQRLHSIRVLARTITNEAMGKNNG